MPIWSSEVFQDRYRLDFRVERVLHAEQSAFQHIEIFETLQMGRVLALDGIYMTSEADEFYYHEMLVHPALTTAPRVERVLIIGGGDGGTAREVLRHPDVKTCVMVEIDEAVVRACREHLPSIGTAFDDPRLELRFEDGVAFVENAVGPPFDVVILDGSDPVGPAEGLFGASFYRGVRRRLAEDGVFALQSESPTVYPEVFFDIQASLREVFKEVHPYFGSVMLYGAGMWTWTWASAQGDPLAPRPPRLPAAEKAARYYNRDVHRAAFAQPSFIRQGLKRLQGDGERGHP